LSYRRSTHLFDALRSRDFRFFWSGLAISNVGAWMQVFALGILVVQIAGREGRPELAPFYLGLMGLARAVPGLAMTLIAGAVADRVDRRRLLLVTQSTMAVNAGVLAASVFFGVASLWSVLIAAAIQSAAFAFDNPARQSMIARIVPLPFLASAIGLQSAAFNGSSIIGPLLGGLLFLPLGIAGLFAANAISFASIIGALITMRPIPPSATRSSLSLVASVTDGARYLRREPAMVWVLIISSTCFAAAGPVNALLPAVAGESVWNGVSWLAVLLAAMGLGSFAGSFGTMNIGRIRHLGRVFVFGAAAYGATLVAFALSANPVVGLVFCFVNGLSGTLMAGMGNNMLQATTDDSYRGRVMSVWAIQMIGLMPVGQLALGALGTLLGIHAALVIGGSVALAAGVYGALRVPAVRDWRAPAHPRIEPQPVATESVGLVTSSIAVGEATSLK
jgi:MFS family permease